MSHIAGKTALVTGGASGIGYLVGRELLARGVSTLVVWDVNAEALGSVAATLETAGRTVRATRVDVASVTDVRDAVAGLDRDAIAIDVLINNAGIVVGKPFASHTHADIDRTIAINTLAPMHVARELLPGMLARGTGHIVNIASAAGMVSNPLMSVYCASKWAVIGWSDSLRLELEREGVPVKVTTVAPYYIDTGMFAGVSSPVIPILKPDYVARRIVDAIESDRIVLRLPRIINLLPLARGILPTRWFDRVVGDGFGVYRSMSTFRGRA